jgi:hypothetical protein
MTTTIQGDVLVVLAHLDDIEEWIAQGWIIGPIGRHPVMAAYRRMYVWRQI